VNALNRYSFLLIVISFFLFLRGEVVLLRIASPLFVFIRKKPFSISLLLFKKEVSLFRGD